MTKKPLTMREQAFIREYLCDLNGTQAAIRAGYSPRSAASISRENLIKPHIVREIQEQIKARFYSLHINAEVLLGHAATILRADARELTSHHIGACRYCWGIEHHYQWRTPREYSEAVELNMLKGEANAANHPHPEQEGGYGYRRTARPHPDCPECDGLGEGYTVFADTTDISPEAAILFEGVEETRNGIKFNMASKQASFDILAKYYGLMTQKIEHTGKDGKPIEHEVATRVVIVPAKIPSITLIRDMPDENAEKTRRLAER